MSSSIPRDPDGVHEPAPPPEADTINEPVRGFDHTEPHPSSSDA